MNKKTLNIGFYILATLSGLFIAYAVLRIWGAMLEGYGIGFESALIVLSLVVTLILFSVSLVLSKQKRLGEYVSELYLPIALIACIIGVWMVVATPYERTFRISLDDNPLLYGGEPVGRTVRVPMSEPEYWMKTSEAKRSLAEQYNKREKDARLIKFSNPQSHPEIVDLDVDTVLEAFGDPVDMDIDANYDIWIYRPWADHPDWTLNVYLNDDRLVAIGESNLPTR